MCRRSIVLTGLVWECACKVRKDLWQLWWAPEVPWPVGNGPGVVQAFKHTTLVGDAL